MKSKPISRVARPFLRIHRPRVCKMAKHNFEEEISAGNQLRAIVLLALIQAASEHFKVRQGTVLTHLPINFFFVFEDVAFFANGQQYLLPEEPLGR